MRISRYWHMLPLFAVALQVRIQLYQQLSLGGFGWILLIVSRLL